MFIAGTTELVYTAPGERGNGAAVVAAGAVVVAAGAVVVATVVLAGVPSGTGGVSTPTAVA